MFRLTSGFGQDIQNTSDADINMALQQMPGGSDSFVILDTGGNGTTYVQVHGSTEDGFDLEYQEGNLEQHFRCATADPSLEQVVAVFQAYRRGDISSRKLVLWEHLAL